jgi:MFS family permease
MAPWTPKRSEQPGEAGPLLDRPVGWLSLLRREWIPSLAVLVGGVLLHSMNVMLLATVLPSVVGEVGGAAVMSWPTTAYVASSIVAATCVGLLTTVFGARPVFAIGASIFGAGAIVCAFASAMSHVILGRFVQGFGGGLLSAVAYVLVRNAFPEIVWARVLGLLAGVWSVSVLVGPLVGGVFARLGNWRGAFFTVATLAGLLVVGALSALPQTQGAASGRKRGVPAGRIGLLWIAIGAISIASVLRAPGGKSALIVLAIASLVVMLRLDRAAATRLLPGDAFSFGSPTGVGLWMVLLLSIAFTPLNIFVPIFLQRLHGFDPLAAGYTVAGTSMAWTVAAVAVAGLSTDWSGRMFIVGPLVKAAGLLTLAAVMPSGPIEVLFPGIVLVGLGIGSCWAFIAQRVMKSARVGDEDVAASSVATVQSTGYALGAAVAGLVANATGFSTMIEAGGVGRAAFWVPVSFSFAALAAGIVGIRLRTLTERATLAATG